MPDCTLETATQILRMVAEHTIMQPDNRILHPRQGCDYDAAIVWFLRERGEAELIEIKSYGEIVQKLVRLKP